MLSELLISAQVAGCWMLVGFVISQLIRRNDIADAFWGAGFLDICVQAFFTATDRSPRGALVLALVALWALRLSTYILARARGRAEDYRYQAWRKKWGNRAVIMAFLQVWMLQGVLMVLVSIAAAHAARSAPSPWTPFDAVGAAIFLFGFVFETVADAQMDRHRADPANRGKLMTSGLWSRSRHPNYFGEVTLWWGIWLIAASTEGGLPTILGPATITFLILKVSGIPMLEAKYEGRADWKEYCERTPAFFPRLRRH